MKEMDLVNEYRHYLDEAVEKFRKECKTTEEILEGLNKAIEIIKNSQIDEGFKQFVLLVLSQHKLSLIESEVTNG